MKKKFFLLGFFLFSLIAFNPILNNRGTQYMSKASVNSEQTLSVVTVDDSRVGKDLMSSLMDLYLGFSLIAEKQIASGAETKWNITSILESWTQGPYIGWLILVSVWNWTTSEF